MNIPAFRETEKAKDKWIRHRLLMTDNEKYVKRGQALIIRDDPQRHEEECRMKNDEMVRRAFKLMERASRAT